VFKNKKIQKLLIYGLFTFAMAYVEAAVVVYLRKIYYPHGFLFPLKPIENSTAAVEIGREAATILMLVAIVLISNKHFKERFALFVFSFGLWDLFYYFWLKVFLNWPAGWGSWDVLFLIPVPWTSPWIAPAIVSISLVSAGTIIFVYSEKFSARILTLKEWLFEVFAGILILFTFFSNAGIVLNGGIPSNFKWSLFSIGLAIGIIVFIRKLFKGLK